MNIFVASLPFQVEEVDVRKVFENYGEVSSVKLITDRETGKKKGFGFVVMPNDDEASKAIKALDGKEMLQRRISVSKAEEKNGNRNNSTGSSSGNKRPRYNPNKFYRDDY
jgi:RNA recognition motif-containing protein